MQASPAMQLQEHAIQARHSVTGRPYLRRQRRWQLMWRHCWGQRKQIKCAQLRPSSLLDGVAVAAAPARAGQAASGSGGGVTGAASMSTNQARAWVRLAVQKMHEAPLQKPYLVPLAMPNQSGYLQMAAEAVMAFNKRGLLLTPYLDATCAAVACAVKIQAAWRAHSMGKRVSLREALVARRAAVTIQRAWRACEFSCVD